MGLLVGGHEARHEIERGVTRTVYVPKHFEQSEIAAIQALIVAHPLGSLVTVGPAGLSANHIPFELVADAGPYGRLVGHVARANPVWREVSGELQALVIFQGANAYITPSWYPSKQDGGRVVPTWNYVAVHVYGAIQVVEDPDRLKAHVDRLTRRQESAFPHPWSVGDAPTGFTEKMLGAIVGLEIDIARLEAKWKVSQNRSGQDREGVVQGLRALGTPFADQMADYVEGAGR